MEHFDKLGVVHAEIEEPPGFDGFFRMNVSSLERVFGNDEVVISPDVRPDFFVGGKAAVEQPDAAVAAPAVFDDPLITGLGIERRKRGSTSTPTTSAPSVARRRR